MGALPSIRDSTPTPRPKDRGLNKTATCTGGFHNLITRRTKVSVNPPRPHSQTDLILIPNHYGDGYITHSRLYLASIQFAPALISTRSGTLNSTADSIVEQMWGFNSSHSEG
jgi:hypothetical protein